MKEGDQVLNQRVVEEHAAAASGVLGYLNYSHGKPDARFQSQINELYTALASAGVAEPWRELPILLEEKLAGLKSESAAFRDAAQAEAVLRLVFQDALPAYRAHHADLLFQLSDADFYAPFFVARVFEAVLAQGEPWDETERIVTQSLAQINDFVGHRPIAILETRPRGETYAHERVRPIPLYLKGAGAACGRYQKLIGLTVEILTDTDAAILADASLDPDLLEELALDPRPYDQGHPANRRPNYIFGEWDPDHMDGQGRFTRFVVRQVVLDALLERVETTTDADRGELEHEAAAVLAGTMLMAAGISGSSRSAHDSQTTLSTLIPRIARYREAFYVELMNKRGGAHGERLQREMATTRQPFGRARQQLNEYLARHRAAQLQQKHLAVLFAEMGFPDASEKEASRIPVASVRMLSATLSCLATANRAADDGDVAAAAKFLPEVKNLIHRGIDCGAFADPWNILGFQALFPLFHAREDSVRDSRIDDLVSLVERVLSLYVRLCSEAAGAGNKAVVSELLTGLRQFATWWDRFASVEVQDVRRVYGAEFVASADHLAKVLRKWHAQGAAAGDLAFWKPHLKRFRSPKAFAIVVAALLARRDSRASLALLINWIGQVEQVPLDDGGHSFHALALEWLLAVTDTSGSALDAGERFGLVRKLFEYLEANAGSYWEVPRLEEAAEVEDDDADDDDEDVFGAAYEGMTYRDSTDDDNEGSVVDDGPPHQEFMLESEAEPMEKQLRFLATVARLWRIAARFAASDAVNRSEANESLGSWLATVRHHRKELLALLRAIQDLTIPQPLGSHESMIEYDRRRVLKEQLLHAGVNTALKMTLAAYALQDVIGAADKQELPRADEPSWQPALAKLDQAIWRGDANAARALLPAFLARFQAEPLLFTALSDGGDAVHMYRAQLAQQVLRFLVLNLPRLGLLRETYQMLHTARTMEDTHRLPGRGVTEFNHLFHVGFAVVIEAAVQSAGSWQSNALGDHEQAALLEALTGPFLTLWAQHSQTVQIATMETIRSDDEWAVLVDFIKRYGHNLFHTRFLTLGNLRGVLHRGVGAYLDYLRDNADPLQPVRLLDDLDQSIPRARAERFLETTLRAVVENYEEYKDYNTSVAQSDYGENLYLLLAFLRLKARYERQAWQFRPLMQVHEVLARAGRDATASLWENAFANLVCEPADKLLAELARLEQQHGLRLRTISDRLHERFVKALALDRLCARVAPAIAAAGLGDGAEAFERFRRAVEEHAAVPTGVGLDVPTWLRRLEAEVQAVKVSRGAVATLADVRLRVPQRLLSIDEFREQVRGWDKQLLASSKPPSETSENAGA